MSKAGVIGGALMLACAGTIAALQLPAAKHREAVKEQTEVYKLPPPEQLAIMTLGYRSAAADLMWADILVTQGFRLQQKRPFETIVARMEGVTYLDPQFREPYLIGDALITFQATEANAEDARGTRRLLELGVKHRPLDTELWNNLGTFVAYLAPNSILTDPDEIASWKRDGSAYLERAIELSGNDSKAAWRALGGGVELGRLGYRDAAVRFFNKVIQVTDDEELKEKARAKLAEIQSDTSHVDEEMQERLDQEWLRVKVDRFLDRERILLRRAHFAGLHSYAMRLIGPPRPAGLCAGGASSDAVCASDWQTWVDRVLQAPDAPALPERASSQ